MGNKTFAAYVLRSIFEHNIHRFNLSSYPFIDSMPAEEDIGFDCEDKINGFYASIKFGCQVSDKNRI